MLQIIFTLLCGGGLFLFAGATRNHGWAVADKLCQQGAPLCDNPHLIVFAGAILVIFAAIHRMVQN